MTEQLVDPDKFVSKSASHNALFNVKKASVQPFVVTTNYVKSTPNRLLSIN